MSPSVITGHPKNAPARTGWPGASAQPALLAPTSLSDCQGHSLTREATPCPSLAGQPSPGKSHRGSHGAWFLSPVV